MIDDDKEEVDGSSVENIIRQKRLLLVLAVIGTIGYTAFLCYKIALSYRSGVASISMDLADHHTATVFGTTILCLYAITHSYIFGVQNEQKMRHFILNRKRLFDHFSIWPYVTSLLSSCRFVGLFLVLVTPSSAYLPEHGIYALLAAASILVFETVKLVERYFIISEYKRTPENQAANKSWQGYDIEPSEYHAVWYVNLLFVLFLFTMACVYLVLVPMGPDPYIEDYTGVAICEMLIFSGIPLGIAFHMTEIHT